MKRQVVLKKIAKAAKKRGMDWSLDRHGANHHIYDLDGLKIPVGRHSELGNGYAEMIWTECEAKLGKG